MLENQVLKYEIQNFMPIFELHSYVSGFNRGCC